MIEEKITIDKIVEKHNVIVNSCYIILIFCKLLSHDMDSNNNIYLVGPHSSERYYAAHAGGPTMCVSWWPIYFKPSQHNGKSMYSSW